MVFTSYGFLGFIAVVFMLYYLVPKQFQWKLLLLVSYFFYYIADPVYILYILVTTVTTYFAACKMECFSALTKQKAKRRKWHWALSCLLLNMGILAIVKYTNFAIANVNALLAVMGSTRRYGFWNLVMPLGISFYTFQAMGYLIDVYRGVIPAERNLFRLALFLSFFPQLVQGPISRYGDLSGQLFQKHDFDGKTVSYGLERILWGYFKKLVIADRILIGVNSIIGDTDTYGGAYVFAGMMFYALELYADFTGGIDITIGVAQVMGITIKENFRRPYFSKSVKEYWRRWHITMGTWFTDYLFYPISVCKPMLKFSRFAKAHFGVAVGKRLPVYLSSFAVWFATGIWHGASWNFIVWGLGNWLVIMVSQELEPLYAQFHLQFSVKDQYWFKVVQIVRTVLLMSCLRIFDCYRNVPLAFQMLGTMFTERNWHILWDGSLLRIGLNGSDYGILVVGILLMVVVSLLQRTGSVRDKIAKRPYPIRFAVWYGLFLAILLTGMYGMGYDTSQFIYNQF